MPTAPLITLIKLQKTRVDEQRLHLEKLQARLEEIEKEIMELEIKKAREQIVAEQNAESRATYGAFVKAAVKKGRQLEKDRNVAAAAVDVARDRLTELFEEQKRYEIAHQARLDAEAAEERRRERIELDEIGGVTHQRNTK